MGRLLRLALIGMGAGAVVGYLLARREAARRGASLLDVLPQVPDLVRRELDGLMEDARAAIHDGNRAAAERRRELHADLADARLG